MKKSENIPQHILTKIKYLKTALWIGFTIALTSVLIDSYIFYRAENTLFKLKSPFATHPLLTPCFLGFLGFIFFLFWLKYVLKTNKLYLFKKMYMLLIGGVIFGWYNVVIEFITFYSKGSYVGCSGGVIKTPFLSPCLFGSTAFLIALLILHKINISLKAAKLLR